MNSNKAGEVLGLRVFDEKGKFVLTKDELSAKFKELTTKLHPDKTEGKTTDQYAEILKARTYLLKMIDDPLLLEKEKKKTEEPFKPSTKFKDYEKKGNWEYKRVKEGYEVKNKSFPTLFVFSKSFFYVLDPVIVDTIKRATGVDHDNGYFKATENVAYLILYFFKVPLFLKKMISEVIGIKLL